MKSIRRRITIWLLVGLTALWIVGGTAIYLSSRSAMMAGIDTENQGVSRQVRVLSTGTDGGGPGRWQHEDDVPSADMLPRGLFYQVWDLDGQVLLRSDNLGDRNLPRVEVPGESPAYLTVEIAGGRRARMSSTLFAAGRSGGRREGFGPPSGAGGGRSQPVLVAVARDLSDLETQSRKLLLLLVVVGLVAAAGSILLIGLTLRHGLRPLHTLGESVAAVDASSLDARFSGEQVPRELQPIVERLDALMDRLEAGFQRERRFGADLAHELRTPIAEIQIMADLSIKWPAERTEQQMLDIRKITERMHSVVDTLLQLARLEGEGENPDREPVALDPVLADTWRSHAKPADERGLRVEFNCPETAAMPGRPELWKLLLGNLLANAAEYTTAGGRLIVKQEDNSLRVANSVEDLQPEQVQRMFERFWRADASRTGALHSGLGLSLAKACAVAMGLQLTASLEDDADGQTLLVITVCDDALGD